MNRLICVLLGILLVSATAQAGPKAAIFPFELIDVSLEGHYIGPRPDEAERLKLATEELRHRAAREAGYEVLDLGPLASEIEQSSPLYKCNGCALDFARRAGAQVAVTVAVVKVSSLLLTFHIYVIDVGSGTVSRLWQVEVRGNTDQSWLRGVRRLVSDGLLGG